MKPLTREEQYLNKLSGEEQTLPKKPRTRKEQYLARLSGEGNVIPSKPETRREKFLANLCGEEVVLPKKPWNRIEQYMAFAGGESEVKPSKPLTREEWYWDKYQGGEVPSEKTVSGNPISISDALAEPAVSLKVFLEPKQDLHGYDHPWPAGGGKNLIDIPAVTMPSAGSWADYMQLSKNIPSGTYTFSTTTSASSAWSVGFYDTENTRVGYGASSTSIQGRQSVTITLTGTASKISGYINAPATMSDFQLELGSTATSYAPYSNICPITGWDEVNVFVGETQSEEDATKYFVSFESQGTVYGGYVDIVSGELVVDRVCVENSTKAKRNENESGYFWYSTNDDMGIPRISDLNAKLITNRFKAIRNTTVTSSDGVISYYPNGIVRWKEKGEMTTAEYVNYLVENPMQLVYELATPLTYQLTPQQIMMLLGSNTVWSDGDGMELTYLSKAAAKVRLMNATLQTNMLKLDALKSGKINKPVLNPISGGELK